MKVRLSSEARKDLIAIGEAKGMRRRVYGNYQIFYRVTGDQIFVIRVLHGARDYDALL
jgi:toxin ParE1/3/4